MRSYPARVLAGAALDGAAVAEPEAAVTELQAETYPARRDGDYVVVELGR